MRPRSKIEREDLAAKEIEAEEAIGDNRRGRIECDNFKWCAVQPEENEMFHDDRLTNTSTRHRA